MTTVLFPAITEGSRHTHLLFVHSQICFQFSHFFILFRLVQLHWRFRLDIRKRFFIRGWMGPGTDSPGQWSWPQATRVQVLFGHCSHTHGLIFMWSCVEPEVGFDPQSMILVGLFQLRIFYNSWFHEFCWCSMWIITCIQLTALRAKREMAPSIKKAARKEEVTILEESTWNHVAKLCPHGLMLWIHSQKRKGKICLGLLRWVTTYQCEQKCHIWLKY